jgi:hypothetical protein
MTSTYRCPHRAVNYIATHIVESPFHTPVAVCTRYGHTLVSLVALSLPWSSVTRCLTRPPTPPASIRHETCAAAFTTWLPQGSTALLKLSHLLHATYQSPPSSTSDRTKKATADCTCALSTVRRDVVWIGALGINQDPQPVLPLFSWLDTCSPVSPTATVPPAPGAFPTPDAQFPCSCPIRPLPNRRCCLAISDIAGGASDEHNLHPPTLSPHPPSPKLISGQRRKKSLLH